MTVVFSAAFLSKQFKIALYCAECKCLCDGGSSGTVSFVGYVVGVVYFSQQWYIDVCMYSSRASSFELARHPDALERCRKEADECFGRDGNSILTDFFTSMSATREENFRKMGRKRHERTSMQEIERKKPVQIRYDVKREETTELKVPA